MSVPQVFRPVQNTSMVHVRYRAGQNQCENTYAYKWSGAQPTQAELLALATEVWGTIGLKTINLSSAVCNFVEVYARNINVPQSAQATYVIPQPAPGARGGNAVAGNEACQLTTRTGFTGRGQHGAKRYSNFSEGDVDGNTISSTLINLVSSLALSVIAARVGGRFTPAVASLSQGLSTIITQALTTDNNVDSQKSRLNLRGR